jgi:molybdate transport system substrate-binding protein
MRWIFCSLAILPFFVASARADQLNVFAAASLTDVLTEIAAKFENFSGHKIKLQFAASSTLARQIEEEAPADIFFSADEIQMDRIASRLVPGSRSSFVSNQLVIVAPSDSALAISKPEDLVRSAIKRIAIAAPKLVPAGIYTKEHLKKLGLWEDISKKVVPTENVRATLAAVESGNVDIGFIYKTDALISKNVRVVFEVPLADGPQISYPVAVLKRSSHHDPARHFLAFMRTRESLETFKQHGFVIGIADSP